MEIEKIPKTDNVSRWIFAPHMYDDAHDIVDKKAVFLFKRTELYPEGNPESVVWRKYARKIFDVHRLACKKEDLDNEVRIKIGRPPLHYRGAKTANVGDIERITSKRNHRFCVEHEPSEGIHHAHIAYRCASGETFDKNDKTELKEKLYNTFLDLEPYSCNSPSFFHSALTRILQFCHI